MSNSYHKIIFERVATLQTLRILSKNKVEISTYTHAYNNDFKLVFKHGAAQHYEDLPFFVV